MAEQSGTTNLPTGTVTFLFTDIEGSTRLVERLGTAGYSPLLEAHQAIVRAVLAETDGVEIKTEGDSFFVVFRSARAAVEAAATIQRELAAHTWPPDAAVRVRMGLHTGEGVIARDTDYVGLDVHRAARIASAGHGGQVLISETTHALVTTDLPDGVTSRDLGEHRLKDLSRPERIRQLVIAGLPDHFPPLKTLDATPNNLPVLLTSFVGREQVLAEARRLLEGARLLTLTGPGGTGKTRLSLQLAAEAADRFPDGVYFVALEPISDPALVPSTIALAVGVQDVGGSSLEERLREYLRSRRVLLVLDNMEQVTGSAAFLGELLQAAPELTCIVTSRAALHVYGEQEYPVPTLGVPDPSHLPPLDELAGYDAIALFVERARAARPEFQLTTDNAAAVAGIAARRDGLPLALELAAARVKILTPDGILGRLAGRLDLLGGGARDLPARQQTLRGAIAWSYDLLEPPARRLFATIAVFVGGFQLEAAEAVCAADSAADGSLDVLDGLATLIDQSLLRTTSEATAERFEMLETIRAYGLERLVEEGRAEDVRRRHAEYFAAFAEKAMPHLTGGERARWLDGVQRDHDNLRAAIGFAVETGDAHLGMRLLWAMWRFWQSRAYLQEGAARAAAVLAMPTDELTTELRARALEAAGGLAYWRGLQDEARAAYDAALVIARQLGDQHLIADELYNAAFMRTVQTGEGDVAGVNQGVVMLREAMAMYEATGDRAGAANALWGIGTAQYFQEDWSAAFETFAAAHELIRAMDDGFMLGWVLHMLGSTEVRLGSLAPADEHIRGALVRMQQAGETTGIVMVLDDFADLAAARGNVQRALRLIGAARALEDVTDARLAATTQELMRRDRYRDVLAADDAERCLAEGRAMDLERAVAYALADEDAS
ncbi:MAG: adenylate/guanylate cyclase domain-containing protein [Candidatus Limnocylindrales bacterium]